MLGGRGWCWVPGHEWAPSWVAWRHGGGHVGWAPLPPATLTRRGDGWGGSVERDYGIADHAFIFIEERHMADPVYRHCLPAERNGWLRNRARACTDMRWRGDRFVVGGPSYDALCRGVSQPWPVCRIERATMTAAGHMPERRTVHHGDRCRVYAPLLRASNSRGLRPNRIAGLIGRGDASAARGGTLVNRIEEVRRDREVVQAADRRRLPQGVQSPDNRRRALEVLREQMHTDRRGQVRPGDDVGRGQAGGGRMVPSPQDKRPARLAEARPLADKRMTIRDHGRDDEPQQRAERQQRVVAELQARQQREQQRRAEQARAAEDRRARAEAEQRRAREQQRAERQQREAAERQARQQREQQRRAEQARAAEDRRARREAAEHARAQERAERRARAEEAQRRSSGGGQQRERSGRLR